MREFSPNTAALMALKPAPQTTPQTAPQTASNLSLGRYQASLQRLCLVISLIFLASCGQKGALYSPDPAHQPNTVASPLESRPQDKDTPGEAGNKRDIETVNASPQTASGAAKVEDTVEDKAEATNAKTTDQKAATSHQ